MADKNKSCNFAKIFRRNKTATEKENIERLTIDKEVVQESKTEQLLVIFRNRSINSGEPETGQTGAFPRPDILSSPYLLVEIECRQEQTRVADESKNKSTTFVLRF